MGSYTWENACSLVCHLEMAEPEYKRIPISLFSDNLIITIIIIQLI